MRPAPRASLLKQAAAVVSGVLLLGGILGAVTDAPAILTPPWAGALVVCTILTWIVVEITARRRGIPWLTGPQPGRVGVIPRLMVLGFLAIPLALAIQPREVPSPPTKTPPTAPVVELAWYVVEDGRLRLAPDGPPALQADRSDIEAGRIPVPIQVAVRNTENDALELVRVEIAYPAYLDVVPKGAPRISKDDSKLIYEHDLQVLEPQLDVFTPIQQVDTIYLPLHVAVVDTIVKTKDGIPLFARFASTYLGHSAPSADQFGAALEAARFGGPGPSPNETVTLHFAVFSKGRPAMRASVNFELHPSNEPVFGLEPATPVTLDPTDVERFELAKAEPLPLLDESTHVYQEDQSIIRCRRIRLGHSTIAQAVSVNNKLRRLLIDANADGKTDYELDDVDDDAAPDYKRVYDEPPEMRPWHIKE